MFCHKCGTQISEGAAFCHNCGTKVVYENDVPAANTSPEPVIVAEDTRQTDTAEQDTTTSVQDTQTQTNKDNTRDNTAVSKEKKYKNLSIILGIIAILFVITVVMSKGGNTDYTAIVKGFAPYENIPYTYSDVFEKYIESIKWKTRKDDEEIYVNISGNLSGTKHKVAIAMNVIYSRESPDMTYVYPESVSIDGEKLKSQDEVEKIIYVMFSAYDEGYSDLSIIDSYIPTKTFDDLNGFQKGILAIFLIVSIILSAMLVNKMQQLYMSFIGADVMLYNKKFKIVAILLLSAVVFTILSLPVRKMFGIA